jgi:hypothetical protein
MLRRVALVRTDVSQEPHGVTSLKTSFFIVTAVKTANLTAQWAVLFVVTAMRTSHPRLYLRAYKSTHVYGRDRHSQRQEAWRRHAVMSWLCATSWNIEGSELVEVDYFYQFT